MCTERVGLFVPKLPWLSAAVSAWDMLKGEHQPEQNRTWQGDSLSPASLHCARDEPNPQPLRWVARLKSFAPSWLSFGGKKSATASSCPAFPTPELTGAAQRQNPASVQRTSTLTVCRCPAMMVISAALITQLELCRAHQPGNPHRAGGHRRSQPLGPHHDHGRWMGKLCSGVSAWECQGGAGSEIPGTSLR